MNSSTEHMDRQVTLVIVTYEDAFQYIAREKEGLNADYQERSAIVNISPGDMKRLGIEEDATVRLENATGSVVVQAKLDSKGRPGIGYMPVSPYANRLASYDPAKAKLSGLKRVEASVEPTDEQVTPISQLLNF